MGQENDGELPPPVDGFEALERDFEALAGAPPAPPTAAVIPEQSLCVADCRHYFEMRHLADLMVADAAAPGGMRRASAHTRRCLAAPGVSLDSQQSQGSAVGSAVERVMAEAVHVESCRHYDPWTQDELDQRELRRQAATVRAADRAAASAARDNAQGGTP
jgi:hypothetical protein